MDKLYNAHEMAQGNSDTERCNELNTTVMSSVQYSPSQNLKTIPVSTGVVSVSRFVVSLSISGIILYLKTSHFSVNP
jgi:hypothetical protein